MLCKKWSRSLSLILVCFVPVSFARDFYCENNGISTTSISNINETGVIHTRLNGTDNYGNNFNCKWILDAGPNKRLYLVVLGNHLQWAPQNAICSGGYDLVKITDGNTDNSPSLALWCGKWNPLSMTSTGQHVTILFDSDDENINEYKGADIQFQVFDKDSCPPGWVTRSPSNPYCYKISSQVPTTWSHAQALCNYNHANLVDIATEGQQDFLVAKAKKVTTSALWTGVNKIESENKLVYLNGSDAPKSFFRNQDLPEEEDCVTLHLADAAWRTAHCTRGLFPYICKTNKRSATLLYKIPEAKVEKEAQAHVPIVLASVLGTLVVIGSVIGIILIYLKCLRKKMGQNYRASSHANPSASGPRRQNPRTGSTSGTARQNSADIMLRPRPADRPPSYNEATRNDSSSSHIGANRSGRVNSNQNRSDGNVSSSVFSAPVYGGTFHIHVNQSLNQTNSR